MPLIRRAILVGVASATLASCGEKLEIAKPPVHLLTCADEPEAPELQPVPWAMGVMAVIQQVQAERDAATLDYVLAMRSAWGDCRAKVAGTRAWADSLSD